MEPDYWQLMGMAAAMSFTIGFVDQLRLTLRTRNVEGMSRLQWAIFCVASAMFTAYYVHLDQWLMVAVSMFGTACCLLLLLLILRFRKVAAP